MNILDTIKDYFSYPFVRNALIVGVLIALSASLLGVSLVLKRFSYIGDGLSHVAFGAMSLGIVLNMTNNLLLIMPVTVAAAILLLGMGQNAKIKGDAAIAMISVGSLAFGYLIVNVFSKSANVTGDVCSTLFGSTSILTLSGKDVWLSIFMSLLVIGVFVIFYNKLFAVTFDEVFALATGVHARVYNLLLATVTAIVISLSMRLVGSLLISALIIFPALSSMRVFKNFRSVIICSAVISVTCSLSGMFFSVLYSTPVGATIVAADIIMFGVFTAAGKIFKRG